MSLRALRLATLAVALAVGARFSRAQNSPALTQDSVFRRAQRMASDGNAPAARALVDSVLAASTEGSAAFIDALFWRATLAESTDQARRDYLRLAVEFSPSPRAEDALLRLAQIELSRGDHVAAKKHLDRLVLEHPSGMSSAPAAYWMGRILFDEGALAAGCASLAEARSRVLGTDVELSNQIAYYARQCATPQRADTTKTDSTGLEPPRSNTERTSAKSGANPATPSSGTPRGPARGPSWSVQIAAYSNKDDATRLAKRLEERGYEARVTGQSPFRVRIGHFGKRAEAVALVKKLNDQRMTAIVVESERP